MKNQSVQLTQPKSAHHSSKSLIGTMLIRFAVSMGSSIAFIWLILGIGDWIFDWKLLAHTGIFGALVVVLLCAFASAIYVLVYLYQELQKSALDKGQTDSTDERGDNQLTDTLMADLEAAYRDRKWDEVIKIGGVLSRPLWVTGKYRLRVKLGKLVEAASAYSHRTKEQASALIDDLGWTKFVLGEVDEAKSNVLHGIKIAEESNNLYLTYKGHRHLSEIAVEAGSLSEASTHYEMALKYAQQLPDGTLKQEAIAGLQLNKARMEIKRGNWEEALRELDAAEQLYQILGDNERRVKLYSFKGEVLYQMGQLKSAKDTYREGLSASKQESRKDSVLQNLLGVAKIALQEGDAEEARRAYEESAGIAHELGLEALAKELETKATALSGKSD